MNRAVLAAGLVLALAAPAAAQVMRGPDGQNGRGDGGPARYTYANPSAGIAADIELSRLSADKKGRWFALRKMAAPDAVMFVPQLVLAQSWLKDRHQPASPLKLQASRAWASCDGSLIVTSGSQADAGPGGWYTNVWRRQDDGNYSWVFSHGGVTGKPYVEPDWVEGKVAECPPRRRAAPGMGPPRRGKKAKAPPIVLDPKGGSGSSDDGSLTWEVTALPGGGHRFTARMRIAGEMAGFRDEQVAANGS